jgi:hypothetical protein
MICKNGFGFAHHGVCVICGENAAGQNEAAASAGSYSGLDSNQRRVFSLPFWPFQVSSRIESQLRSYRESELQI